MGGHGVHLPLPEVAHLSTEGEVLLRASVGRYSDERAEAWSDTEVTARAWEELGMLMA